MSIEHLMRTLRDNNDDESGNSTVPRGLEARVHQQAAVTWLGQRALASPDAQVLMDETAALVSNVLDIDLCKVLELLPNQNELLLRAGIGWNDGLMQRATVRAGHASHAGYTLLRDEPVIISDVRHESRFSQSELLVEHGVMSGISAVIRGQIQPFGVIGAYTTSLREFSHHDSYFLQSVANVLAAAMHRIQVEEALRCSEAELRALVDMAPDVIFSLDARNGTLTNLSSAFEQITGWSRSQWLGCSFAGLLHPNDLASALTLYQESVAGRVPPPQVLQIQTSTGDFRLGEFRIQPRIVDGDVVGVFGIARDVTDRHRVDDELRQSRDELAVILRGVTDGIIVFDHNAHLVFANDGAAGVLELPAIDAMLGQPINRIFANLAVYAEDGRQLLLEELPSVRATTGTRVQREILRFQRQTDSAEFWLSVSSTPIVDVANTVRYVITIYHDITSTRQEAVAQALLGEVSRLLSATLDIDAALELVAREAVATVADWCLIDRLEPDGSVRRLLTAANTTSEAEATVLSERFPLDITSEHPIAQVIRTSTPMLVDRSTEGNAWPPPSQIAAQFGYRSCMIAPIVARGRTFGALTLVRAESGRTFSEHARNLTIELAHRVAIGIDNARLFQEAQAAEARVRALSDASRAFSEAGLNLQPVVEAVAQHVGQLLGDQCVVRLISDDGEWLTLAAAYHVNPAQQMALTDGMLSRRQRATEGIAGLAVTSGERVLMPQIDLNALQRTTTPEYARYLERHPIYSMAVTPLRAHDQVLGCIGIAREQPDMPYTDHELDLLDDLADRAAISIENALLYARAQDAVKVREQFLSIASHELKTPLTSVKAASQLLTRFVEQSPLDLTRVSRIAGQLSGEVSRLEGLVFDLLDATQIQQGRLALRLTTVDMGELVHEVLARFEHHSTRLATHQIVVDDRQQIVGTWDRERLDQVLTNIISNALKYSPDGGEIRVSLGHDESHALVRVSDQGLGISPEDQARLFQPFSRGEIVRQSIGGTGLGLYISSRIMRRHGGTIHVHSAPGTGSTFTLRLPLDASNGMQA